MLLAAGTSRRIKANDKAAKALGRLPQGPPA